MNKNLEKPNSSLQILIHPLYEMSFETFLNNAFNSNFDVKYNDTAEFSKSFSMTDVQVKNTL